MVKYYLTNKSCIIIYFKDTILANESENVC